MKNNEFSKAENFYIGVAKFTDGDRLVFDFDTYDQANNYYEQVCRVLVHWTLIEYKNGKAILIHDCSGDGIFNAE